MTSLYLVAGIIGVIGILVWIVVGASRSVGELKSESERASREAERRRKFDAEFSSKPLRTDRELLRRLRALRNRRLH